MEKNQFITINSNTRIVIEGSFYNEGRERKSYTAWLLINNENVGMIRYLTGGSEATTLCDIEIREDHRGNKLGSKFIQLLETHVLKTILYTTGHYTPEGYHALKNILPLTPDALFRKEEPVVAFRSMNFVHDWQERYLIH